MNDQDIIKQAYADCVKKLFGVFWEATIAAGEDQGAHNAAKQNFSNGLTLARSVRDRALAVV